jgi:leucyl/phenylalanyl-tRNA--protein transferase
MTPFTISPGDDPDTVVDALVAAGYEEELCLSPSLDPDFVSSLMAAGFLVMSFKIPEIGRAVLLPKLHRHRSVVDFADLHESRSVRRLLGRYELRFDEAFDEVVAGCVATHGDDWLTDELIDAMRTIRAAGPSDGGGPQPRPVSFALYREGRLVAGEFGVAVGGVYTSYSGYRTEDSAGSVQLALTGRYLRERGCAFWDLGMPLEYKARLGARDLETAGFVSRFRDARSILPRLR